MSKQTIDTYKLTGVEEPSDEVLSQLIPSLTPTFTYFLQ